RMPGCVIEKTRRIRRVFLFYHLRSLGTAVLDVPSSNPLSCDAAPRANLAPWWARNLAQIGKVVRRVHLQTMVTKGGSRPEDRGCGHLLNIYKAQKTNILCTIWCRALPARFVNPTFIRPYH